MFKGYVSFREGMFFFVSVIFFVLLSHVAMYFEVQLTIGKVRPVATHSHPVTRNRIFNLENTPCTKNMEAGTPTLSIFQSAMVVHQDIASTMVISSLNQLLGDLILPKHRWQQWVVYLNPPYVSEQIFIYPL